jgi:hypothetical protein
VTVNDCSPTVLYLPMILRNFAWYAAPCGPANNHCEDNNTAENAYGPLRPDAPYSAYHEDADDWYDILLFNTGTITVRVTDYSADGQLLLYTAADTNNSIIRDFEEPPGDGIMEVSLSDLAVGTYYIRIHTGKDYRVKDKLYTLTVID